MMVSHASLRFLLVLTFCAFSLTAVDVPVATPAYGGDDDEDDDDGPVVIDSGDEDYSRYSHGSSFQALRPKITRVEQGPPSRVIGSLSMPEGSPWCNGEPTYW